MTRLRLLAATALAALVASGSALLGAPPLVDRAEAVPQGVCPVAQVRDQTRAARAVFTGTVTEATAAARTDGQRGRVWTQTVEVERIYKGPVRNETTTVTTDQIPRQCTLGGLDVGSSYVFFVQGETGAWQAVGGGGTAAADATLVAQVQRLLGSGRSPVVPEREPVELTPVDTAAPARLSRLAAPGAALVIVGLLGLLVVSRLARRPG